MARATGWGSGKGQGDGRTERACQGQRRPGPGATPGPAEWRWGWDSSPPTGPPPGGSRRRIFSGPDFWTKGRTTQDTGRLRQCRTPNPAKGTGGVKTGPNAGAGAARFPTGLGGGGLVRDSPRACPEQSIRSRKAIECPNPRCGRNPKTVSCWKLWAGPRLGPRIQQRRAERRLSGGGWLPRYCGKKPRIPFPLAANWRSPGDNRLPASNVNQGLASRHGRAGLGWGVPGGSGTANVKRSFPVGAPKVLVGIFRAEPPEGPPKPIRPWLKRAGFSRRGWVQPRSDRCRSSTSVGANTDRHGAPGNPGPVTSSMEIWFRWGQIRSKPGP